MLQHAILPRILYDIRGAKLVYMVEGFGGNNKTTPVSLVAPPFCHQQNMFMETLGSKHIIFYFINIYPTELKLPEFECPPKRKTGNIFLWGFSHGTAAILDSIYAFKFLGNYLT